MIKSFVFTSQTDDNQKLVEFGISLGYSLINVTELEGKDELRHLLLVSDAEMEEFLNHPKIEFVWISDEGLDNVFKNLFNIAFGFGGVKVYGDKDNGIIGITIFNSKQEEAVIKFIGELS